MVITIVQIIGKSHNTINSKDIMIIEILNTSNSIYHLIRVGDTRIEISKGHLTRETIRIKVIMGGTPIIMGSIMFNMIIFKILMLKMILQMMDIRGMTLITVMVCIRVILREITIEGIIGMIIDGIIIEGKIENLIEEAIEGIVEEIIEEETIEGIVEEIIEGIIEEEITEEIIEGIIEEEITEEIIEGIIEEEVTEEIIEEIIEEEIEEITEIIGEIKEETMIGTTVKTNNMITEEINKEAIIIKIMAINRKDQIESQNQEQNPHFESFKS